MVCRQGLWAADVRVECPRLDRRRPGRGRPLFESPYPGVERPDPDGVLLRGGLAPDQPAVAPPWVGGPGRREDRGPGAGDGGAPGPGATGPGDVPSLPLGAGQTE